MLIVVAPHYEGLCDRFYERGHRRGLSRVGPSALDSRARFASAAWRAGPLSARVAVAGRVDSQYLIGAASLRGHSMSSHSSGRGVGRPSSRCAGRTRTAAKRERIAPLVPWRQVTVRQARAGSCWAKARTLSGRCRPVRRTSVGGRPCPRYFGGGSGARPGAHTVVSVLMPTTYAIACAVSASRKAVTTP